MTFDITGLLIFLLAVLPGFVAQQSRYSIAPRSLRAKSALEETGEYVLDSAIVHGSLVLLFTLFLGVLSPETMAGFNRAMEANQAFTWAWEHRFLLLVYFVASIGVGFVLGLLRGVLALNQPIRNLLLSWSWFQWFLSKVGIQSFLQEEPVWYGVLRQSSAGESVFLQVKMKNSAGFYSGELKTYGILDDSERDKDFYLVNAYFRPTPDAQYVALQSDGVLLNFGDVESIEVIHRPRT